MPHITLAEGVPGIRGPMLLSPETTQPMRELAEVLLRGPNSLTPGDRELIATYVSSLNDCYYCQHSHGAVAAEYLGGNYALVECVKQDFASAEISDKLKSLLKIAGKVQQGGKHVSEDDVTAAKQRGATDREIHDTVLIAAAFCMFNRYVDGLATWQPENSELYKEIGQRIVKDGYGAPGWQKPIAVATSPR